MRIGGTASWQVTQDEAVDLHAVLFVRDSLGLSVTERDLPGGLMPAAPDLSTLLPPEVRRRAAAAWPAWWDAALDTHRAGQGPPPPGAPVRAEALSARLRYAAYDGPRFDSLSDVPALHQAARAAFEAFLQWWSPPLSVPPPAPPSPGGPLGLPGVKGQLIDLHLRRWTVHDVVTRIEQERGRTAKPFDFRIDILAVTTPRSSPGRSATPWCPPAW